MNFKLRLKNKTTLLALVAAVVAFGYTVCDILGIAPKMSEESVMQGVTVIINLLCLLGIVVDPTTEGIKDSARAMSYDEPSKGLEDIEAEIEDYWDEDGTN